MGKQEKVGESVLEQIEAARRVAILRDSIKQEEDGHYSEAIDGYRQIIDQYHGTPEEAEARERMLDLAHLFQGKGQSYRAKHLYWLLELLYTPQRFEDIKEVRQARVKEILDQVHAEKRAEEERRARLEAEGL
ncbi:MAG: hypothetical protein MUP04_06155 [Anaerolineae bacterium]|jgi:hypothetical protein|nr:hypothetical protein [Anaerolineae bacterium]